MRYRLIHALALVLLTCSTRAATLPVVEGFESYADGTPLTALGAQGWGASADTVVIRTLTNLADAVRGTNALAIPEGMAASNAVTSTAGAPVWIDILAHTSMGMSTNLVGAEAIDSNKTVEIFLDTNGIPVVWNPGAAAWQTWTQDVWRTPVTAFATSEWARLTLCEDYSNKTAALFLDEHLLFTGLPFINTNRSGYGSFEADGGANITSYLDELSMRYVPPTNRWTADLDNDGMLDATEIQLYGSVSNRHRPLVTVAPPAHGTITPNGTFDVLPGATTSLIMQADAGYYVADAQTNGQSIGAFPGRYTNSASFTWAGIVPDGLSDATFAAVFTPNPQVVASPVTNGSVTPAAVSVYPFTAAAFALAASNGYYLANLCADGVNVGDFPGRYTASGSYTWPSIGLAGGVLSADIQPNPQILVTPATNGTVTPANPSAAPFSAVPFTLTASPGYYVANVYTNGANVGGFSGRYTGAATYTWPSLALAGGTLTVEFARKPQVTVSATAVGGPSPTGGSAVLSAAEVYPGGQVTCSMTADIAYVVSALYTNGGLAATFGAAPRAASTTVSNIWSDMSFTAAFAYTGRLAVTNDYATIGAALAAALPGDTVAIGSGTYAEDVAVARRVTLQGDGVTVVGSLAVQAGAAATLDGCNGFNVTGQTTVAAGALLEVTNGSVNVGRLVIDAGGTVQVFNATAFVADGATLTGTFTLDAGWGTVVIPQTPPYSDPFERYAAGTLMSRMGYFGWDTASTNVVVQSAQAQSNRAVEIVAGATLASVRAPTPASNVWTECYYCDTNRVPVDYAAAADVDTNVALELFVTAEGYVTVFDADLWDWVVCSNDYAGAAVSRLPTQAWARVTVNQNYASKRAAVFLDGRLLRQQLRFINTNLTGSGRFQAVSGFAGSTFLDTFSTRTNWVGIVSGDVDGDGIPDALEVDRYGDLRIRPYGSVFRFQ